MKCKNRAGEIIFEEDKQDKLLERLYGSETGRRALGILVKPSVSKLSGTLLDSRLSKHFISPFLAESNISMDEYEEEDYESYNQFFTRRVREGQRSFPEAPELLGAPCDGRITAYPISQAASFTIKHTVYTMEGLLRSRKLAKKFEGGILCILRLTVEDYHHFCYVDGGERTKNYHIPGVFHTVNPTAGEHYPIYTENTREFCLLKSNNFGTLMMMEVGAMLVGKIVNHHEKMAVRRGMEKGFFEYGGSTVILAFQKDKVIIDEDILKNTAEGFETAVKMGEQIGRALG